jgi:RsbT co-antagonist protein rsbRD N-terminal domain
MPPKKRNRKKSTTVPANPRPNQQSIGVRLAEFIEKRHGRIISQWEEAVRRDRGVPAADELTRGQLRDHIPEILTGLSMMLCDVCDRGLAEDVAYTGAMHGHMRWRQQYDISQLLREIGDLRVTLIHHLFEFQEDGPDFGGAQRLFATVVFHSYFDRLMRASVEEFFAATEHAKSKE